jgi:hypothetical protein
MIQHIRDAAKFEFREQFMSRAYAMHFVVAPASRRRFCGVLRREKIAGGTPALPKYCALR